MKNNEILEEGVKSAFSNATALYIATLLGTKWQNWNAYKLGLISDDGRLTDKAPETKEEKESLNLLNNFDKILAIELLNKLDEKQLNKIFNKDEIENLIEFYINNMKINEFSTEFISNLILEGILFKNINVLKHYKQLNPPKEEVDYLLQNCKFVASNWSKV